jgi:hypothetical protein
MKLPHALCLLPLLALASASEAQAKTPAFRAQDIDTQIEIGYGLAIADVQGDGKPDILLADKKQFVWYEAPSWKKHVIAENLTEKDNVCIAARDIDGDGKCEIAVGAEWNPGDTVNSGAVFYLVPPADRTQKWEAIKLPHEPTVHRMRWVRAALNQHVLVMAPLHGRGNKNGEGEGVRVLAYTKLMDPRGEWRTEVISNDMHLTHNFDVVPRLDDPKREAVVIGGREGLTTALWDDGKLQSTHTLECFSYKPELPGFGEVRLGKLRPGLLFAATIEPMHGTALTVFTIDQKKPATTAPPRQVLDDKLDDGHALACADLLGLGRDQIVVGWRANANKLAKVGLKLYVPDDAEGSKWTMHVVDDNGMACEDVAVADLNADGKLDIIAAGRRTKNVKVYWNETK